MTNEYIEHITKDLTDEERKQLIATLLRHLFGTMNHVEIFVNSSLTYTVATNEYNQNDLL